MATDNFDKSIYRSRTAELHRANNLKERQINSFEKNSKERALRQAQRDKERQYQRSKTRVNNLLSKNFLSLLVGLIFSVCILWGGKPNYRPEIVANETIPTYTTESGAEFIDFSNYNPLDNAYLNSAPSVFFPRLSLILDNVGSLSDSLFGFDKEYPLVGTVESWGDWGVFNWLRDILYNFFGAILDVVLLPANVATGVSDFVVSVYDFFKSLS